MAVAASAQTVPGAVIPPSEQPGRERFQFNEPRAPLSQPGGPGIALPSTTAPPGADKIILTIRDVRIEGSTVYSAEQLRPLYAGMIGHETTLQAVYDLAQRITSKYGSDGYVLSRAVVPPQNLAPGGAVIRIQVIEGYVDKVVWPASLSLYRDFFTYYAARIVADRPVNVRTIERYLLLAGDLPGLKFSSSLKASETNPNAATLLVEVVYKPVDAIARIDNRGTPARGPLEYLGSATVNNVFGLHDALTLTYAGVVPSRELIYGAVNYRQVLTSEGLAAFVNASDGLGKPGTAQLEMLEFKTRTLYLDTGLTFPLIRTRERNLSFTGLFFASDSASDILNLPFNDDRLRGFRVKADADMADPWSGINQFNVTVSQGINGLGSTGNFNPLASRLDGRVDFTKIEGLASRTQPLYAGFSAYLAGYGQYATTSLLTPEQCGFGGRFFGRAFDPSALLSDSCYMGTVELRYDIAPFWQISQAQLYGYTDGAEMFNRVPGPGFPSWFNAASAGVGLRLGWLTGLSADLTVAKGIAFPHGETAFPSSPVLFALRDDTRFFFSVTAKY